jgi:hypothetical protein
MIAMIRAGSVIVAAVVFVPALVVSGSHGPTLAHAEPTLPSAAAAKRDATVMYEAFLQSDLDTYAKYMYPRIVKLMGGKDHVIDAVRKVTATMEEQSSFLQSVAVDAPAQVYPAGAELHALLPMTMVSKTPKGELHLYTYLLGVSADKGKSWTFIDASKLSEDNVRKLFPDFNPALKFPAKRKPRLVEKPA